MGILVCSLLLWVMQDLYFINRMGSTRGFLRAFHALNSFPGLSEVFASLAERKLWCLLPVASPVRRELSVVRLSYKDRKEYHYQSFRNPKPCALNFAKAY